MHVGITKTLISDVNQRIYHVMRPKAYRVEFGVDDIDKTFTLPWDHPVIRKVLWREYDHLEALMPVEWCEKLTSSYRGVRLMHFSTTRPSESRSVGIEVRIVGDGVITMPPMTRSSSTFKVALNICPELEGYFHTKIREEAFQDQWVKIRNDVTKFLNSTKSLNAALKAWPQVEAFIPAEYLERVRRKVERASQKAKVDEALANINRDDAVAAATLAALAA